MNGRLAEYCVILRMAIKDQIWIRSPTGERFDNFREVWQVPDGLPGTGTGCRNTASITTQLRTQRRS